MDERIVENDTTLEVEDLDKTKIEPSKTLKFELAPSKITINWGQETKL